MNLISRGLASLSLMLKQPLASFCEIESSHGDALITKQGDYLSFVRLDGMLRMSTRADIERIATARFRRATAEQRGEPLNGSSGRRLRPASRTERRVEVVHADPLTCLHDPATGREHRERRGAREARDDGRASKR